MTSPVSARDRLSWLLRTSRSWALVLLLLVVALAVGVTWTFGLFDSSSANPENVVTSGSMTQTNSADNAAIMSATDLVPGQSVSGSATITNEGDASGAFTLRVTDVVDKPGPAGGRLSAGLQVRVEQRSAADPLYTGSLGALTVSLGRWAPSETRTYDITVTLPDRSSGDDAYQASSVTATFTWDAVQAG